MTTVYEREGCMKKILCFGDSNTFGYVPAIGERFDSGTRWTGILSDMLKDKGYKVIEAGVNGRTTVFDDDAGPDRNGSEVLLRILRENDPIDYALVMLGTNDCKIKFGADADMITKGMETIVSQIRTFDRNIGITIVCPAFVEEDVVRGRFAENFDFESVAKSKALKEKYRVLAEKTGCGYIALCDFVLCDAKDGIHLNKESHRIAAKLFADYFLGTE